MSTPLLPPPTRVPSEPARARELPLGTDIKLNTPPPRPSRHLPPSPFASSPPSNTLLPPHLSSLSAYTAQNTATMGSSDVDQLAINTIRVLAVRLLPLHPLNRKENNPAPAKAARVQRLPHHHHCTVALSVVKRTASQVGIHSHLQILLTLGRCHGPRELGPSGCPDVSAPPNRFSHGLGAIAGSGGATELMANPLLGAWRPSPTSSGTNS